MANVLSVWVGIGCWIAAAFLFGVKTGLVVLGCILIGGPILVSTFSKKQQQHQQQKPAEQTPNG